MRVSHEGPCDNGCDRHCTGEGNCHGGAGGSWTCLERSGDLSRQNVADTLQAERGRGRPGGLSYRYGVCLAKGGTRKPEG